VGKVENHAGNLTLRIPEAAALRLQPAIDTLRAGKAEALALLSNPDVAELTSASTALGRSGVRIMALEGGTAIGVWSDLDGPEVRAALRALELDGLPVRYLDGDGIPIRYKVRKTAGEPVPMSMLREMEKHPSEPWTIRDQQVRQRHGQPPRKGAQIPDEAK
jgi:hypothetical protein